MPITAAARASTGSCRRVKPCSRRRCTGPYTWPRISAGTGVLNVRYHCTHGQLDNTAALYSVCLLMTTTVTPPCSTNGNCQPLNPPGSGESPVAFFCSFLRSWAGTREPGGSVGNSPPQLGSGGGAAPPQLWTVNVVHLKKNNCFCTRTWVSQKIVGQIRGVFSFG